MNEVYVHVYNELYNMANEKHAGGKWETVNQLGVALQKRKGAIVRRIRERMVRQAAHQHELALSRRLLRRPKKTRCVETLGLGHVN